MNPIPIATHDPKSRRATIWILPDDLRRSVHVIGKTGVGKSALLERLLLGAIRAGFGICLIDPHGDLASRVLGLIRRSDIPRVVRFAPADERPVGLELLGESSGAPASLVASELVDVFRKLWGAQLFGPRSEHVLRNAVLVLLANSGTTLPCLTRLLVDAQYRSALLEHVTDPLVRMFWTEEFPALSRAMQAEVTAPVLNKLGALGAPAVRRVLGQKRPRLSMRAAMDDRCIVVADLSGIGRDATQLLGALLVAQVTIAARGRAGSPEAEACPLLLVADEFHAYVTSSFAELLAEGRKFGVSAVLAHQFIAQVPRELFAGVVGSVGTLVAFRLSGEDAEALAPEFAPELTPAHLVRMRSRRVAMRLLREGEPLAPMICRTIPPDQPSPAVRDRAIRASRERYGRPAARVDREVAMALSASVRAHDPLTPASRPRRPYASG